jgi:hypothetical protein
MTTKNLTLCVSLCYHGNRQTLRLQHEMFSKKRRKIVPIKPSSEYIQRRYEDTSPRVLQDIKRNRGLYCSYVPWLQENITAYLSIDRSKIDKYWLDQVPLYYYITNDTSTWNGLITDSSSDGPVSYANKITDGNQMKEIGDDLTVSRSSICTIL